VRPEHPFIAQRLAAQHCAELLGPKLPSASELAPALNALSARLALACSIGLARLSSAEAPIVRPAAPRETTAARVVQDAPKLASHAVLAIGGDRLPVLLSCEAAPVFRLVDRAFGGRGTVPDPLPIAFPLSAELLILRLEHTIAAALQEALGGSLQVTPLDRDTNLVAIAPFAADETVVEVSVAVEEPGCEPWTITLAFPQASSLALFGGRERKAASAGVRAVPDPMSEPYASLPMALTAVLVDMAVPFSRIASLQPGDVLPVAVARAVPIKAGARIIATGTIGEFEDRVAVQITTAFPN
jgi:flagellar motor switch protein FliM